MHPTKSTLSLAKTIAAPPPDFAGTVPARAATATAATSILPRVTLAEGQAFFEAPSGPRYVPLKRIGAGGMGEVALVEDRDIGRTVARKSLLPGAGAGDVLRFVDEVRTVGRLDHPSIVPIHDVGLDERGEFFFVMKYVDGETLESIVDRLRAGDTDALTTWDTNRRVDVVVAVLRALEYAHEHGVLHRDVKPANIMVGRYGEVTLMDWGIARPIGGARDAEPSARDRKASATSTARAASTVTGSVIGTPLYMSPEQARGETDTLAPASDLYSLCVVLHELLTERHLHEEVADINALLTRIIAFEPTFDVFASSRPVPAEYQHFLMRGLALKPADRWSSAREMLEELHAIRSGKCRVFCSRTLAKRSINELAAALDTRPRLVMGALAATAALFVVLLGTIAFLFATR